VSAKAGPPSGESWIWQTRGLLSSDAWRSQSIGCHRLINFLMHEYMNHAGKHNGKLRAPRRQLEAFGIGAHSVTKAILEAEELCLLECHRGGMRVANVYTLTWLPLHDGTPPSNRWRLYHNPKLEPLSQPKPRASKLNGHGAGAPAPMAEEATDVDSRKEPPWSR